MHFNATSSSHLQGNGVDARDVGRKRVVRSGGTGPGVRAGGGSSSGSGRGRNRIKGGVVVRDVIIRGGGSG